MKRFFQVCVAIATAIPFLLGGSAAQANGLAPTTGHGAAALISAAEPVNLDSSEQFGLDRSHRQLIQAREDFLAIDNCLYNETIDAEAGISLICQARVLPIVSDTGTGGEHLQLGDIADRDSLKLDLVLTNHSLESGASQGVGVRFRL